jgi:hypothetical protein
MSEERRASLEAKLRSLGYDLDSSQDAGEARMPCDLSEGCEAGGNTLILDRQKQTFRCTSCNAVGSFDDLLSLKKSGHMVSDRARSVVRHTGEAGYNAQRLHDPVDDAEQTDEPFYAPAPVRAENAVARHDPKVLQLTNPLPSAAEIAARAERAAAERRRSASEKVIIASVASIFLIAGLAAAALAAFANYQAFSSSVADPLQARIWGWTGVIAAVISFGGFTLFYWHWASRRPLEGLRALIFALIGAATSVIGTEMYITANNQSATAEVAAAGSNRAALETLLADWRTQLAGIPPDTRSVEGLEAYIAEVERVGKTDQKPYRDARNELGLARRRDELQAKIEAASAELLGLGDRNILLDAKARSNIPSWFFAVILEVFASQGTSIGLVALLVLFGRRRTR